MKQAFTNRAARACVFASGALALCASATGAQADEAELIELAGQCRYSDQLAPLREQNHTFAECDRLKISRDQSRVELTFEFPARLRSIAFSGEVEPDGRLKVSRVRLRSSDQWDEAEGTCEFDAAGANYRQVTCLVKYGARFFVASFEPDR